MKTGLVLEGGALRAIFSSGVCDALLDGDIMTDYVSGVSAGIAYGVSYVSRQPRRNLEIVAKYAPDKRYMGMRNMLDKGNRSYFGLEFTYRTIPNKLVPFDYDTFAAYPGEVEAVVTNLNTGKADYLPVPGGTTAFWCSRPVVPCLSCSPSSRWTGSPIWTGAWPTPSPGSGPWTWAVTGCWWSCPTPGATAVPPTAPWVSSARSTGTTPILFGLWRAGWSGITAAGTSCSAWSGKGR